MVLTVEAGAEALYAGQSHPKTLAIVFGALGFETVAALEYFGRFFHHAPGDVGGLLLLAVVLKIVVPAQIDLLKSILWASFSFFLDASNLLPLCLHFSVHVFVLGVVFIVYLMDDSLTFDKLIFLAALFSVVALLSVLFWGMGAAVWILVGSHIIINFWRYRPFKACSNPNRTRTINCWKNT